MRLKLERMDANPFAFFRGTDHLFAREWPAFRPPDVGPSVLLCGDLHLENFGAYQADDGEFLYDVNDFDEALIAPCSLDLVRCTTSILLAAELWRLTPLEATGMVLAYLEEYRAALSMTPRRHPAAGESPLLGRGAIAELLGMLATADHVALLERNTEVTKAGKRRLLRIENKHPEIRKERVREIKDALAAYGKATPAPEAYKVLDVTGRIAGIGSLGLRRYLVLVEGGGPPDENLLLDIKEARPSCLHGCTEAPQPDTGGNEARRVVEAQRTLQARPTLGLDVVEIQGEGFRMRQMIPEENRSSLDRFQKKPEKLRDAVEVAGRLTGWSHLRGVSSCREAPRRREARSLGRGARARLAGRRGRPLR